MGEDCKIYAILRSNMGKIKIGKVLKKSISSNTKYFVGIDVGGTSIKFGIFKGSNKLLVDKFSIDTIIVKKDNEKHLINGIFEAIENYCNNNKYGVTKKNIIGMGFAMPGPAVGNQLLRAVNINWKNKYDIVKATKKRFGSEVNVTVLNDANAATLGEYNKTLKGKCHSMCLITLGTAVGTGIIIDEKLIEGKTGIAGELCHIKLDYSDDAFECTCGNRGCSETLAGSKGLINLYKRLLSKNDSMYGDSVEDGEAVGVKLKGHRKSELREPVGAEKINAKNGRLEDIITAKYIIDGAKAGDKLAYKALDMSLGYVSDLIAILMHVFEPEIVLIGGGISNAGTFIINMIKKHLKERVFMTKTLPKIMIAKLKNDAGIYGAVVKL